MLKMFTLKRGLGPGWELIDQERAVVRTFGTKAEALAGGVLDDIVKEGSVRVHNEDGSIG